VIKEILENKDLKVSKASRALKAILGRLVLKGHKVFKEKLVLKEKTDIHQLKVPIIGLLLIRMKLLMILQKILIIKLQTMWLPQLTM
jgi:hypothetical protein